MWRFWKKKQPESEEERRQKRMCCSFCGKNRDEVKKLIAGPTVYICDECVNLCNEIIAEECELEKEEEKKELVIAVDPTRPKTSFWKRAAGPTCALCGITSPISEVLLVPDRGPLCFVCLDVIRAASENFREEP